jgi:hypothetical protein
MWCSLGALNVIWVGAIAFTFTAGDALALATHARGSFIALILNGFLFFFTAHCYQRMEKIQSALLQIGSAFSQNAAC